MTYLTISPWLNPDALTRQEEMSSEEKVLVYMQWKFKRNFYLK